ncbi:MAG: hypothetical protein CMQ24_02210 [Gammaproteobacteria bacterium]|nr:hypothetical protein [Gammaproteobacteria bacterium]
MQDLHNWLESAIKPVPRSQTVEVGGAEVHFLRWPGPDRPAQPRPGVLFVHGHAANAHWWDWTAPALLDRFDVVALDLSGNGDSDHRDVYTSHLYAEEMLAVAAAAGLQRPILVGHSFGGTLARLACHLHPAAFRALLLVDSALPAHRSRRPPPPLPRSRVRHYESLDAAVQRFRLRPPQPAPDPAILRHVADHSVLREPDGYRFKLDPGIFARMTAEPDYPDAHSMLAAMTIPCGLVYGARSRFFPPETVEAVQHLFAPDRLRGVANAHHHLFLDEPRLSITTIRDVLISLLEDD